MSFEVWWNTVGNIERNWGIFEKGLAMDAFRAGQDLATTREESIVKLLKLLGTASVEKAIAQLEYLQRRVNELERK